uniref:Uncharacterized protein n=1 Tax=Lactuca sativa TaxID=4236 RepID=A0A9R1X251_LACSA|nr:hypothetical protein LSAT_V11C700357590 [Lactuca sativa]
MNIGRVIAEKGFVYEKELHLTVMNSFSWIPPDVASSPFAERKTNMTVEMFGDRSEEYHIEGCFSQRNYTIYDSAKETMAEIKHKVNASTNVMLGKDVFSLTLKLVRIESQSSSPKSIYSLQFLCVFMVGEEEAGVGCVFDRSLRG